MFGRRGFQLLAVIGWLGLCPLAESQQPTSPAVEDNPVTAPQEPEDTDGQQDAGAQERNQAEKLAPALEKIEAAIRDLIAKPDVDKDQGKKDREVADLKAQQSMALWAERMFWASLASLVLTLVGIALIWRTLHHTRRAANYAGEAVTEAKEATEAAKDATKHFRSVSKVELRPWLAVTARFEGIRISTPDIFVLSIEFMIENVGKTAAMNCKVGNCIFQRNSDIDRNVEEFFEDAKKTLVSYNPLFILPNEKLTFPYRVGLNFKDIPKILTSPPSSKRYWIPIIPIVIIYNSMDGENIFVNCRTFSVIYVGDKSTPFRDDGDKALFLEEIAIYAGNPQVLSCEPFRVSEVT